MSSSYIAVTDIKTKENVTATYVNEEALPLPGDFLLINDTVFTVKARVFVVPKDDAQGTASPMRLATLMVGLA